MIPPNPVLETSLNYTIKEWLRYHQDSLHFIQSYRGIKMCKNPFDLVIYEELIWQIQPTVIIEIGTAQGGFAVWLHDRLPMLQRQTKIINIDLDNHAKHNIENLLQRYNMLPLNIYPIIGDCNDPKIIAQVKDLITPEDRVLIIEDSAHTVDNTLQVLNNYKEFVTLGSYFIIEDGICDVMQIHPVRGTWEEGQVQGPMAAIEQWIPNNSDFIIDRTQERYIMTYNPKGYLKRIS